MIRVQDMFQGNGTIDDPYLVSTIRQLDYIRHLPHEEFDAIFLLTQDIDASETAHWANPNDLPNGFVPIQGVFQGIFSGGGFRIKNLTIMSLILSNPNYPFDYVGPDGLIENLILENLNCKVSKQFRRGAISIPFN